MAIEVKIDVYHHHESGDIAELTKLLRASLKQGENLLTMQANVQAALDNATAKMTALTTVVDSAVSYIQDVPNLVRTAVAKALADAQANGGDEADVADALNKFADTLDSETPKVVKALTDSTTTPPVVAPPTPDPVPVS